MYICTVECPECGTIAEIEWPKDENYKCHCGASGYWGHYTAEEDQPLSWFWDGEEE